MPASCQTLVDAVQFDGLTVGTGRFDFEDLNGIPRSTRVVITSIGYTTDSPLSGGSPGDVIVYAVRDTLSPPVQSERIILGTAEAGDMITLDARGAAKFCGIVLPRDPPAGSGGGDNGRNWRIEVLTDGKEETASVCVDYVLQPFPDTDDRDSGRGSGRV